MNNRVAYLQPLEIIPWQTRANPTAPETPVDALPLYVANCIGATSGRLTIIGEAPDLRADTLLTAMLNSIGLHREEAFLHDIANVHTQLPLLQPSLILALGDTAAQQLLNTKQSLESLRGQIHAHGDLAIPLICTYHPSYLLHTPSDKKKAYIDLKLAIKTLASPR